VKFRLDKLSTFGLLSRLTEPQAISLIDALLVARLLMQVEEQAYRPLVRLTPRGEEVMKGQAELTERLNVPDQILARLKVERPAPSQERREQKARESRQTAPAAPPLDDDPFDEANSQLAAEIEMSEAETAPAIIASKSGQPPHYWLWRLFQAGFTAAECQQIRGLSRPAILEQLLTAGRAGLAIEAKWVLSPEQLSTLREAASNGSARPPLGVSPQEAEVYALARCGAKPAAK
jgi:hypothetical protein